MTRQATATRTLHEMTRKAALLTAASLIATAGAGGALAKEVQRADAGMLLAQADTNASDTNASGAGDATASNPAAATGADTSSSGSSSNTAASQDGGQASIPVVDAPEPSGSVSVSDLMAGEALPDVVIGDADAPVTIVEYASMTCPHCADFHSESLPAIKKAFIDTGKAKLILREFPFDPRALAAFMLARCTGDDAKRSAMVDVLFDQQADWARADNASEALLRIAKLAGMSQDEFAACLNNKELQEKVVKVQQRAQNDFGVSATPTFFVNGDKYTGALSPEQMAAVIRAHEK